MLRQFVYGLCYRWIQLWLTDILSDSSLTEIARQYCGKWTIILQGNVMDVWNTSILIIKSCLYGFHSNAVNKSSMGRLIVDSYEYWFNPGVSVWYHLWMQLQCKAMFSLLQYIKVNFFPSNSGAVWLIFSWY